MISEETTSADIASVEMKVGQRREDVLDYEEIEEGYVHDDIIKDNLQIKFFDNHRSNDSFRECFDVQALTSRIYAAYSRRAYNSSSKTGMEIYDLNVVDEDITIDDITYALNICCKHKHVWHFKGFAQHGTQLIFGIEGDDDKTVVIYQHFPRIRKMNENFITDFFKDLFKSKDEKTIYKKIRKYKEDGYDLNLLINKLEKRIRDDYKNKDVFKFLEEIILKVIQE